MRSPHAVLWCYHFGLILIVSPSRAIAAISCLPAHVHRLLSSCYQHARTLTSRKLSPSAHCSSAHQKAVLGERPLHIGYVVVGQIKRTQHREDLAEVVAVNVVYLL